MANTEIFYHGTCYLFDKFSSAFLGAGEGKSKFGQGIYITSSYKTAALYASKAAKANGKACCYVYTVEVPQLTADNHVFSCKSVNADVVQRVEETLGEAIPNEVKAAGKLFRKYLGNLLTGQRTTVKKMMGKADAAAENAVSAFLNKIGVGVSVVAKFIKDRYTNVNVFFFKAEITHCYGFIFLNIAIRLSSCRCEKHFFGR
jgi:hypothetical protein